MALAKMQTDTNNNKHQQTLTNLNKLQYSFILNKLQQNINWDGKKMKVIGNPEAEIFVQKKNRTRWL